MRVLIQRVRRAAVRVVEGDEAGETARIGPGLLALVGFAEGDDPADLSWMAGKLADLRIFPSQESGFERSLRDTGGELLLVSQFTLLGDARKGRRPDFGAAAGYGEAERLYDALREACEGELPGRVATGSFGALMEVELVNDGPVTLMLER